MILNYQRALTVLLCGLQLSLFGGVDITLAAEGPPPAPVSVVEAEQRMMAPVTMVAGSVVSRHDAQIAAEVSGRLVSVVEVGEVVKQGGEIARLDDTQLLLQQEEYQADVMRAEAKRKFLEQEVERLQRLAKENNAARTRLEQTEADRDVARGDLASSSARLKQVQDRFQRATVRAPFPGVVVQRIMQRGEWVDSGDEIVRLVDASNLEVQVMVPLATKAYVSEGQQLAIQAGATTTMGKVRSLLTVGDPRSRLLDMRLDFSGVEWSSGQTVRVVVPTATAREVIAVPRDALVLRRSGTTVYRIKDDNTAERIEVSTGVAQGDWIEVIGDIRPGDRTVVRGSERLRPGQNIFVINANAGNQPGLNKTRAP